MAGRDGSPRRRVRGQACGADRAEQRTRAATGATPWTLPGVAAVLFSGLNGDIQTLWPNVASEAVAPTGPWQARCTWCWSHFLSLAPRGSAGCVFHGKAHHF